MSAQPNVVINSIPKDPQSMLLFLASHDEGSMGVTLPESISADRAATLTIDTALHMPPEPPNPPQRVTVRYQEGQRQMTFTSEPRYQFYTRVCHWQR